MKPFLNAADLYTWQIKTVHAAIRDLAMDDTTYRALLLRVTGKTSSKECTSRERQLLLEEFTRLGWKQKAKKAGRALPKVAEDRMPRMRKIEALLAEAERPWAYLKPLVENLGKSDIAFCDGADLSKIIAALVIDAQRHGRKTR
ncbi:MAG: regulatory protein GemA [Undibacterium sp.]|nr:regulatory protein GemA [Undibacterium sp.]